MESMNGLIWRRTRITRSDLSCMSNVPWRLEEDGRVTVLDPAPAYREIHRNWHLASYLPPSTLDPVLNAQATARIQRLLAEADAFLRQRSPIWWALWSIQDAAPLTRTVSPLPGYHKPGARSPSYRSFVRRDPEASWRAWTPSFQFKIWKSEMDWRNSNPVAVKFPAKTPEESEARLVEAILRHDDLVRSVVSLLKRFNMTVPFRLMGRMSFIKARRRAERKSAALAAQTLAMFLETP